MAPQQITAENKNGAAVASLVLGILSIFLSGTFILGILAIIFGVKARKRSPGNGMASAGIITGIIGTILSVITIVLLILIFTAIPALQRDSRNTSRKNDVMTLMSRVYDYKTSHNGNLPTAADLSTSGLAQITSVQAFDGNAASLDTAYYAVNQMCDGTKMDGMFSMSTSLEHSNAYCVDDNSSVMQ